jgi:hypothetical protein
MWQRGTAGKQLFDVMNKHIVILLLFLSVDTVWKLGSLTDIWREISVFIFPWIFRKYELQVFFSSAPGITYKTHYRSANLMRTAEMSFTAAGYFNLVSAREFIQLLSVCALWDSVLCVIYLKSVCSDFLRDQVIFPRDKTVKYNFAFHLQSPLCASSCTVISGTARHWPKLLLTSYSWYVNPLKFNGNSIYHLHETQRKICTWCSSLTSIDSWEMVIKMHCFFCEVET